MYKPINYFESIEMIWQATWLSAVNDLFLLSDSIIFVRVQQIFHGKPQIVNALQAIQSWS